MTAEQDAAALQLLELYADLLEHQHGPCLAGRIELMAWIDAQFLLLAKLDAPEHAASDMINSAYVLWQAEALGLDINDQ
ncbi:hypothetical protein [Pseudomonas sp. G(2018)]|uniref:hypothetical protein n=1 Tax=Pseudomonas sp. G(2018) TaxID=2502242 RepID=UPI0010F9F5DD|nr:hypothetical protein [Pseudomonas sp. G(2018)]